MLSILYLMIETKIKRKCEICGKIFKPMTDTMWKYNKYQHNLMCKKHKSFEVKKYEK